jgi:diguanylate cyclase (GGDEF)-like protein
MSAMDARPIGGPIAALEAAGDLAYAWDLDNDAIEWSGRLGRIGIEFATEIATGRLHAARIHPEDLVHRQLTLSTHFEDGGDFDCEYRLRDAEGGFVWVHERGRVVRGPSGSPQQMLGVIRAIADVKAQQTRLETLTNYDELTGHFNRTRLRQAVDQVIAAGQRSPEPAAFLAIGVDNMAAINARFGQHAADTVLVEIGRRLDLCLRVSDLVGRLGGDRFGIVLSHCPLEHLVVAAEKVLGAIRTSPIATPRGSINVTVSVGGASFSDHGLTSYDVITCAETALSEAKLAGRDCYVHYQASEEQRQSRLRCLSAADEVHAALREDRVLFAYQPIVAAASGAVEYYECLLRVRDAEGQIVASGALIPMIERLGGIRLLDRCVLDRVIAEVAAHPDIVLGFNISGLTAADRPWLRSLTSQLRARPDLAGRLVVEITETAVLYDIEESARFVQALRQAGCRVALDDFGAGHTSLRHLQSLAVDMVKIDRAFIQNIAESPESQVFLRHLLGLAKSFGFSTVAEGIETADEAAILRREGVNFLQGFYYGRPSIERPWLAAELPVAEKASAAD